MSEREFSDVEKPQCLRGSQRLWRNFSAKVVGRGLHPRNASGIKIKSAGSAAVAGAREGESFVPRRRLTDIASVIAAPATGLDAGPRCSAGLAGSRKPPEQVL